ncbi:helix-turn-helix domain-containing protein [Alteribacillus iranensis]|uniref:Protein RodZ, contains Xre-like HTH and DUF4115 domains n=1 Tax=Alteribacillus iranensis TaxID=930128 RepID=A0A1I2A1D2_9BACI|nr:helix-turn-helix domain-containing protein [Alteribacillus iranensis]SFE37792.1 protein RodZ, contains Xre-like HTH and DUF4115 domains [Alteribacillus iranensis]
MSELGHYLKTKREEQGISLERLKELTKIQKRYLAAIEEGRHEALPGAFYARAFVKSYSEALGLNPEEVLETYGSELPQPKQQTNDFPSRAERTKSQRPKKKKKSAFAPVVFGIIFFVVVAAGIYLVIQGTANNGSGGIAPEDDPSIEVDSNDDQTTDTEDNNESSEEPASEDEEESVTDEQEQEENEENEAEEKTEDDQSVPELVSTNNRRSVYDASNVEEMVLEIELDGNSYLDVQDESGSVIEDFAGVQPGDTVELDYSDRDYVNVNIGNTTAVTVRFNGEVIEYPDDAVHQYLIFDKTVD